jgi:hypothetical protein
VLFRSLVDATLIPVIPWLPLVPIGLLAVALARRAAPRGKGAIVGVVLAIALEKSFGSGDHWISMGALGAVLGAWPPHLFGPVARHRPLVLLAIPVLIGIAMGGMRLGFTERWNCSAGTIAAAANEEFTFFHTESGGTSMAVVPSNLPSLIVLRGGTVIERLQSGIVAGTTRVEPPGGILLTPPQPDMPVARLVSSGRRLLVEWWDPGTMQRTMARVVDADCSPAGGTMEVGTLRVWVVCEDEGQVIVVDPTATSELQVWRVGGRPQALEMGLDALTLFGTGPLAHGEVFRIPDLQSLKRRSFGPWAAGMAASPQRIAVGRGPAGHLQIFGTPHTDGARSEAGSYASELARSLDRLTDSVRVGNWPGVPHRAQIGDAQRGWYESVWVTSPVDARLTLVDLDATWHQRSVLVGAPVRSVWVDADNGTLYGMNRCGVFSLRLRTTFPWDP